MKKIYLLLVVLVIAFCIVACKSETVTLHCDGEGCENMVEVKVTKDQEPDEDWVVFCQTCADDTLDD